VPVHGNRFKRVSPFIIVGARLRRRDRPVKSTLARKLQNFER
jgi:hypothetical protein